MHIKEAKIKFLNFVMIFFLFFKKIRNQTCREEREQVMFLLKGKVWETHPTHV